jgi:hypothetical protein
MKLTKYLAFHLSLAILCIGLAGCASTGTVAPLSGGYEEVAHPQHSMDGTTNVRISFQHRTPDDKITRIWPSLYGVDEVIKGDTAIFVGDVGYMSSNPDDPRGLKPRLFAVRSPALPLDITDEVLWRWSKASGKDFATARQIFSLVTPAEKGGRLELQLEFWTQASDWPDKTAIELGWDEVSDIMRAVKENGTTIKDIHWGTSYRKIGSNPNTQK